MAEARATPWHLTIVVRDMAAENDEYSPCTPKIGRAFLHIRALENGKIREKVGAEHPDDVHSQ